MLRPRRPAFATFRSYAHDTNMQSAKPTIVLVPGAWHSPSHYTGLIQELQEAGYIVLSQQLPTLNPATPADVSVASDTAFVRQQLLAPLVEAGVDVLLVTHSYGSVPGAAAAVGMSRTQRVVEGKAGGVLGLVCIAGFLFSDGDSLFNKIGGRFERWDIVNVSLKPPFPFSFCT